MTISLSQQIWFSFLSRFSFVQSMLHCRSDSRLWIQQVCAFTHRLLAALSVPPSSTPLSISISMADWMSQMANAVDEHEAATAAQQEEVPTEPATSPRSRTVDIPVNDGRWTTTEYAELLFYIAQDLHERDQERLYELWDRQQADARTQRLHTMEIERQQAEAAEHEAHQRSIQEWENQLKASELRS